VIDCAVGVTAATSGLGTVKTAALMVNGVVSFDDLPRMQNARHQQSRASGASRDIAINGWQI